MLLELQQSYVNMRLEVFDMGDKSPRKREKKKPKADKKIAAPIASLVSENKPK